MQMSKEIKDTKRKLVFKKYGGKCAYCGCILNDTNFNVDHINPLYRGYKQSQIKVEKGTSHIDNLNPSCYSCNSSKSTYSIDKWREELQLKTKRLIRDSSQFRIALRFGLIVENKNSVVFYFETLEGKQWQ
jgi:5-methylcytosine-specific restriction endonuclease McrA